MTVRWQEDFRTNLRSCLVLVFTAKYSYQHTNFSEIGGKTATHKAWEKMYVTARILHHKETSHPQLPPVPLSGQTDQKGGSEDSKIGNTECSPMNHLAWDHRQGLAARKGKQIANHGEDHWQSTRATQEKKFSDFLKSF